MKKSSNKSFGILFFIVFLLIGIWPILKQGDIRPIILIISFVFLILGLLNSNLLTPLNNGWIKFGEILGRIIAPIVMSLIFFTILTPIGIIVKVFGKDLLKTKLSKEKSYWIVREKNIGSMKRQF
jgi:hypothetical protein